MDDLLECTICSTRYNATNKVPLSLICGHTFCKECLQKIGSKGLGISCPNDKQKDLRSLNSIPKNYSLLDIIELMKSKVKASDLIVEKSELIEQCRNQLETIEVIKKNSAEEKIRTMAELEKGFNVVREKINYRESELMKCIELTHENISQRAESLVASISATLSAQEVDLKILQDLKNKSGDVVVNTQEFSNLLPAIAGLDDLEQIASKLPIQVLIFPMQFDNFLQSFAKVIDDTQSRVTSLSSVFVSDVRVKDGDKFMPSSTFVKTWRLRNDGELEWPNACCCVFSHGSFKGDSVVIDPAWPGEEVDISVVLSAPLETGKHFSYWKLVDPNGLTFGPLIWAEIEVYNIA